MSLGARLSRIILLLFLGLLSFALVFVGVVFWQSPASIRVPGFEHAHFRMQLLVGGVPVNFSEPRYQTPYEKNQCSDELAHEPIHFHDNRDQMVHIHWKDITGGQVLKYYGWNMVGGFGDSLGFRFDGLPGIKPVPLHGNALPAQPRTPLYVFVGDEHGFKERQADDFLHQSLEDFFGVKSKVAPEAASLLDVFFRKAVAHNDSTTPHSQEELRRINNLLGNVVLFAQSQKPTDAEVRARFLQLEPLADSTCGG